MSFQTTEKQKQLQHELHPFREYFESLDRVVYKTQLAVDPQGAFGYTGTLEENALRIRPGPRSFNSQGIQVQRTRRHIEIITEKKSLLQQYEDINIKIKPVVDELRETVKMCHFCGAHFEMHRNYGTWRCKYHPNSGTDFASHECCGNPRGVSLRNGCTPCDHLSTPLGKYSHWDHSIADSRTEMPIPAIAHLGIPEAAVTIVSSPTEIGRSKCIVSRVYCNKSEQSQ